MNFKLFKNRQPVNEDADVSIIIRAVGSGLFSGYIPFASGTFGSLVGLLVFLIPNFSTIPILSLFIVAGFFIGVYTSEIMVKRYGDDPAEVVIDEIVGLWFTFFIGYLMLEFFKARTFGPAYNFSAKLTFGIVCFVLFRFFDIIKLQPAKYFDEMKSGYGIMLDDISAGLYAGILSSVVTHFVWFRLVSKMFP
jgi:phosphatidylglycerophosphatase A